MYWYYMKKLYSNINILQYDRTMSNIRREEGEGGLFRHIVENLED